MEQAAAASDSTKAVEIKNQAVEVLSRVSRKFSQTATEVRSSNDFNEGVSYVMNKSKELYENTMKKIEELSKKPELVNAFDKVNEKLDKAIEVVDSKVNDIKKSSAYEDAMNDLGSLFDGVKRSVNDFTSKEEDEDGFVREIYQINVNKNNNEVSVTFEGSGFMRYQIRNMIGSSISVANKKESLDFIEYHLQDNKVREIIAYKAPANGLYLVDVLYK